MKKNSEKITVALRGAGGLLGHRILRTIERTQPDMRVDSVILGTDKESFNRFASVRRLLNDREISIFVDAKRKRIKELEKEWNSQWSLEPLDQAFGVLGRTDAIIDAAIIPGKDSLRDFYSKYVERKPIIFQSGTYPLYTPLAPPFEPEQTSENQSYRQGDCLVSGIAPVVHALREYITKIDLSLVVQRQTRLNNYTLRDNLADIIVNPKLEDRVKEEVAGLLPHVDEGNISAMTFEVPGHDYYVCIFRCKLNQIVGRLDILNKLEEQPRIAIALSSVPISTGQVQQQMREQMMESGIPLEPVVCFSCPGGVEVKGDEVTLRMTFYSKAITVLPNVDSVRGLVKKMPMIEAMRLTDKYHGFR